MNKILTKVTALCVGLAMVAGVGVAVGSKKVSEVKATDASWVASEQGYSNAEVVASSNIDSVVSITFDKGSASNDCAYYDSGTAVRIYNGGSFTISVSTGTLTSITLSYELNSGASISCSDSTGWTASTKTWSGSSDSVTWTAGTKKHVRLSSVSVVYSTGSSDPAMAIRTNEWATSPFELTYGDTTGITLLGYDPEHESTVWQDGMTWSFSNNTVVNHYEDGYSWTHVTPKAVGSVEVTCSRDGYQDGKATINVVPGTLTSIVVSGSMSKTSYYVGESWSAAGLTATANYDSGYSYDASSDVVWTFNPSAPATTVSSVVATATMNTVSGNSSAQAVTVTKTNPLQVLYSVADNTNVDVYGVYVGFLNGSGPIIMDGAYGILCYNKTADVSGYTAGTTILHVTGKMGTYNGLRQIASPVLSVASGEFDEPETPIVYAAQGGETAEYASRLTTVTGVATCTKNDFSGAAGANDITMSFDVSGHAVQVFYKKAAQTADTDAYSAMKTAVEGGTEITVKGFTGWYNGFQVQMDGVVQAVEGYTAEDFAQDLLNQTDAVCTGWEEGVNNHDTLVAIWSDLASADKYPSLPSDQKTILAEAERDESGTVVEQAMARYDFLTGKYNLSNFINGRTPIVPAGSYVPSYENNLSSSSSIAIIVIVAVASMTLLGVTLVLRKRKHQ